MKVFRWTRPQRIRHACSIDGCLSSAVWLVFNSNLDEWRVCSRCAEELTAAGWHLERKI